MTLHDDAERLRALAGSVPVEAVADLGAHLETVGYAVAEIVGDSEPVVLLRDVLERTEVLAAALVTVRTLLEHTADHHDGDSGAPTPTIMTASRAPDDIEHAGSRYPHDAVWALAALPRRVRDGETHTYARIKIGSDEIPGLFASNTWDAWVDDAKQRMATLRIRAPGYLANHVEIRAATMMIHSGVRDGEIVMNHVPCGYADRARGCHQVLEQFLPSGTTLTVLGSDQAGRPFRYTYRGKAPQ
jgi:hypothetical protein